MFQNLLLEEDQDSQTASEFENSEIYISISDTTYPSLNAQQGKWKKYMKGNNQHSQQIRRMLRDWKINKKKIAFNEMLMKRPENGAEYKLLNKKTIERLNEDQEVIKLEYKKIQDDYIWRQNHMKVEPLKALLQPLPMILGGLGLAMTGVTSQQANANQLRKELKCPTIKEVKKASQQLLKANKEFQINEDEVSYNEKIKPLNLIKENYEKCQKISLYM